jgi:hypothetical protein
MSTIDNENNPRRDTDREMIHRLVLASGSRGITTDEIPETEGRERDSFSPRMAELRRAGLVMRKRGADGFFLTRKTRLGKAALIFVVNPCPEHPDLDDTPSRSELVAMLRSAARELESAGLSDGILLRLEEAIRREDTPKNCRPETTEDIAT